MFIMQVKGAQPSLPICQDLTEEQIMDLRSTSKELKLLHLEDDFINLFHTGSSLPCSDTATTFTIDEYLQSFPEKIDFSTDSIQAIEHSVTSLCAIKSKRRSVSFSDEVDYVSKSYSQLSNYRKKSYSDMPKSIFGKKETTVYMTLFDDFCCRRTSGTQATASINKCLQASHSKDINKYYVRNTSDSNNCSTCNTSTLNSRRQSLQDNRPRYSDIYYFGKKNNEPNRNKGMGGLLRYKHQNNVTTAQVQHEPTRSSAQSVQAEAASSNTGAQTKRFSGGNNGKMVSIKESKPCPATSGVTKGDMVATVSHIRIGPREPCPVHGKEPCQGPRCIVAASGAEDQAPVKVSTMTNPRRGVFELVIRRMNGAPLARNELMLEWTPPPPRPSTCGSPCGTPCATGLLCRPSRCKMLVCRPSPCRPARCCKKSCKRPCGPIPCRNIPCKKCYRPSCCGNPCRYFKPCRPYSPCQPSPRCRPCPPLPRCRPCPPSPRCRPCPPLPRCRPCPPSPRCRPCSPLPRCRPCPPSPRCRPCSPLPRCRPCSPSPRCRPCSPSRRCKPCPPSSRCRPCPPSRCRPCPPSPCKSPCGPTPCCNSPCQTVCCSSPCSTPCKSSPCLRPCPVGYRRPRKFRSQPKIKAHRKLISPCYNRSKTCPVVRCRSVPGPCIGWCSILPCPPRKCCSVFPCPPRKCYPTFPCSTRKCCMAPCPPRKCCPPACPPLKCCPPACPPSKCCPGSPCKLPKCCPASPCKLPKCCKSSCGNCS